MIKLFTSDLRRNLIKIFCLSTGLAIGLLIVAKVYYEETFDEALPDIERIYRATEHFDMNGEYGEYYNTAGGIAPGLKRYLPQVEKATRYRQILAATRLVAPDGKKYEVSGVSLADTSFFDVLQTRILRGDPREALAVEWNCMIPASLARKIGADPVGMTFYANDYGEEFPLTVAGVYEDFPLNSSISNDVYVSLSTLPRLRTWDNRDAWMGGDSYRGLVMLVEDCDTAGVHSHIRRMLEENIDADVLDGVKYDIGLKPLRGLYASNDDVKIMNRVLGLLALIILVSASVNYLLVVMAQMQWRAREMAVRKCYGTSGRRIFGMVMGEGLAYLGVSLLIAALIVASLSSECGQILGADAATLLGNVRVWFLELTVCLAILAITGIVPAWLYCRTPVTGAFRRDTRGKRMWKLALLSVQFFASALLFCLLATVWRQYSLLSGMDPGYEVENLAMADIQRISDGQRRPVVEELRRLGCVTGVATADQDLTSYAAGNCIYMSDDPLSQVNVADFYGANPELFDVTGMRFRQGGTFEAYADSTVRQVVVLEPFIEDLRKIVPFEGDMIIGRGFSISEHSKSASDEFEVRGVVGQVLRNGFSESSADRRSGVFFPTTALCRNLYVRFADMTPEALDEARGVIDRLCPEAEIVLMPVKSKLDAHNAPIKRFGNSVMIAGLVIFVITLIGLTGYAADEVHRRAREIAIRKVNGMSVGDILRLLCGDVMKVALPSTVAGAVVSYAVGNEWMSQFTDRAGVSVLWTLGVVLLILGVVAGVVVICCLGVVRANPVRYLRDE